jgi:uncharacterized membrane protein
VIDGYAGQWLELLLRWVHLITGIAWIGASFYFIWLDNSLRPPASGPAGDEGVGGELWAIHGGGFYHVQKYRVAPPELPAPLHWFKWEAYSTWLSGFALFVAMYWAHARTYMIDPSVADITPAVAIAISIATIVGSWVLYDQLCKRLGFAHERWLWIAIVLFVAASAFALSHVYSGRAVYYQVGAMLGTWMVANVAHVIIPSQRKLVEAKREGRVPEPVHGLRGKQRSVHNNYLTLPVLFVMISNHYPMTWGHPHAWLVLLAILLLAGFVRHFFNLRHKGRTAWWIPIAAGIGTLALAVAMAPAGVVPKAGSATPPFADVERIVVARCSACHAESPRQAGFAVAPKGVMLDTPARIRAHAAAIEQQAVRTHAMPIGNLTGMTDDERAIVGSWIAAGAP